MAYRSVSRSFSSGYGGTFTPGVKWLLVINTAIFVVSYLTAGTGLQELFRMLSLAPVAVLQSFAIWQLFTYQFLHGGFLHLLFNMLTLWMFGTTLERDWGTRRFLKYYLFCGVGAGLCDVAVNALIGNWNTRTIGSSGAVYGLLLAFGVLYPNVTVLFNFLFPLKAKYFVMIYGAMALLGSLQVNTGVSNVAHLGGMLFGFAYLKLRWGKIDLGVLRRHYQQWKLQRAKRKFQVYLRKHGSGSGKDRWVQ
jgi:membrane associated rhomboid family serine protease